MVVATLLHLLLMLEQNGNRPKSVEGSEIICCKKLK